MGKEEVIEYVMTTPNNPNRAVLEGMLDSFSDGEGGDEPKRVLLYENDALDISVSGASGIHFNGNNNKYPLTEPFYYDESGVYTLEIDGEVAVSGAISYGAFKLGLISPSDTDGVADGKKAGVGFTANTSTPLPPTVCGIVTIMINDTYYSAGTHSVKIYKEV